jgi:hypothetical protein
MNIIPDKFSRGPMPSGGAAVETLPSAMSNSLVVLPLAALPRAQAASGTVKRRAAAFNENPWFG